MGNDTVTLSVPARDEYARTVRMTAVTLAGRAGASMDTIDDVRIAVEEAFIYACGIGSGDERMTFEFSIAEGRLGVRVGPLADRPEAGVSDDEPQDRYARFILESVCDEFDTRREDTDVYILLSKQLADG